MCRWQRVAIHRDCDERPASVEHELGREPDRETIDRSSHQLRRPGLQSGELQHSGERDPRPKSVAYEVTTHLIRYAGDGDVILDELHSEQVVVGERKRVVDESGDAQ